MSPPVARNFEEAPLDGGLVSHNHVRPDNRTHAEQLALPRECRRCWIIGVECSFRLRTHDI